MMRERLFIGAKLGNCGRQLLDKSDIGRPANNQASNTNKIAHAPNDIAKAMSRIAQ